MKTATVFCLTIALTAVSCAKDRTAEPVKPKTEPERSVQVVSKESDVSEKAEAKPKSGNAISGTAVLTADTDGGAAEKGEVNITLSDEGGARGTLKIAKEVFSLSGEKQEDNLRLWAVNRGARQSETKRGYLIGRATGNGFEGTFAFSTSGGEQKFQGTWEASAQPSPKP